MSYERTNAFESALFSGKLARLPQAAKVVVLFLTKFETAQRTDCFPGIDLIAKTLGMSNRTVQDALIQAEEWGVVTRFHRPGASGRSKAYKTTLPGDPEWETAKIAGSNETAESSVSTGKKLRFNRRKLPFQPANIAGELPSVIPTVKPSVTPEDSAPSSLVPDEPSAVKAKKPRKDPNTGEPTRFVFALKDGTDWTLNTDLLNVFNASFPDIDVDRHLGAAMAWTRTAIPSKRKTATGMPAFIRNWLTRQATDARFTPQKPNVAAKQNANAEYEATMAEAYRLKQEQEAAFERNKAAYAQRSKGLQPT